MISRSCFSAVLALLLIYNKGVQCFLDWSVVQKIDKYGEEAALFCQVDDCCDEQAGWTKEYHQYHYETIYVDVINIKYNATSKYDGRPGHNGFYLFIRNVSEEDLKLSYTCSYGFDRGIPKILQKSLVFRDVTTNVNTACNDTDNDHHNCSLEVLILLLCVVILMLILVAILVFKIKQDRKHWKNKDKDVAIYKNLLSFQFKKSEDRHPQECESTGKKTCFRVAFGVSYTRHRNLNNRQSVTNKNDHFANTI